MFDIHKDKSVPTKKKKGKKKLAFFSTLTYHNTLMTPDSPANWVSSN